MFQLKRSTMGILAAFGVLAVPPAFAADAPKAASTAAPKAKPAAAAAKDEVAVLETSKGRMVVEFWEKDAPKTVANFKKLAKQGYFDGTGFHRIIKGFMIQGGDPKSKNPKAPDLGTGDPGYKIDDEFNARKHVKGVLSMANSGTPNSAGSQFFIMHAAASHLDGKYTGFGKVTQGLEVLDAIANTPVGPNAMMGGERSKPLEWVTVKSVRIVPRSTLAAAKAATKSAVTKTTKTADAKTSAPATKPAGTEKAAATPATPAATKDAAAGTTPSTPQGTAPDTTQHSGHNH